MTSSVIYYSTHARTAKCNLFVLYNKNSNGLLKMLRDVWGMEKDKAKSADVDLTSSMCVSSNRSPATTNEDTTLLYKYLYIY